MWKSHLVHVNSHLSLKSKSINNIYFYCNREAASNNPSPKNVLGIDLDKVAKPKKKKEDTVNVWESPSMRGYFSDTNTKPKRKVTTTE